MTFDDLYRQHVRPFDNHRSLLCSLDRLRGLKDLHVVPAQCVEYRIETVHAEGNMIEDRATRAAEAIVLPVMQPYLGRG